jgi:hypothetical protein
VCAHDDHDRKETRHSSDSPDAIKRKRKRKLSHNGGTAVRRMPTWKKNRSLSERPHQIRDASTRFPQGGDFRSGPHGSRRRPTSLACSWRPPVAVS